MVSSLVVATLASGAAIGQALNSLPSAVGRLSLGTAETGHVEVVEDEVNLLQSSVKMTDTKQKKQPEIGSVDVPMAGPIFTDRLGHDDVGFGSFTSEDNIHCIEGDFHDSETAHSLMRASPVSRLYYSREYVPGATCESRGYSELFQASDDCWEHFTRWIRPGTPMARANYGTPAGGLWANVIDAYDQDRGYPQGTSREWVACGICTDNSALRTGVFGQSYDCASALDSEPRVIASMRLAESDGNRIPRGSVLPTSELVCFEGTIENLENYLVNARRTPLGALFADSVVTDQNCEERGFNMVRDLIDECWPEAAKVMRTETEDEDLWNWVMSYWQALHYDTSELSDGTWDAFDWVSCNACSPGGAVRARGLWTTMHGGDSLPYSDEYCRAAHFPDIMT